MQRPRIAVIVPALNEELSIGHVLKAVPALEAEMDIVVVDNGSTDRTAQVARQHGARVVQEPRRGYGAACLKGLASLANPDLVVFLDADYSDHPEELGRLVEPILAGRADFVVGSRMRDAEPGALTLPQRFGNALACSLMRWRWGGPFTDLGPFRAIRHDALQRLEMTDRDFGWTVQMQIRALQHGLRVLEVPVRYRRRLGVSKISGTIKGVLRAGTKILYTFFREALKPDRCSKKVLSSAPSSLPAAGVSDSCVACLRLAGHNPEDGATLRRGTDDPHPSLRVPDRLIVFSKYPEPGTAKTRMIPLLGPDGAATLQREMALHLLARIHSLAEEREIQVEVRYTGGDKARMREAFGTGWRYREQGPGDLGQRMAHAFQDAFDEGVGKAVVVGSDTPDVTGAILQAAFDALDDCDMAVGPAEDGGYYLLGLRAPCPALFQEIAWSTQHVLLQTLCTAHAEGRSFVLLDRLRDVDRPEDWPVWERMAGEGRPPVAVRPWLSVIVPARNEADRIGSTLDSVLGHAGVEVLVVDGASGDATAAVAEGLGARVETALPGRARQMNAGAAYAQGTVLLFLHADTRLPPGFEQEVRRVLAQPNVVIGAFRVALDAPGFPIRWVERGINLRSRCLGLPYGDQALFMDAATFRRLGGFPDIPLMEDFELVRRLGRAGRVGLAGTSVTTSARRWRERGVLWTTLLNQTIVAAYLLGVAPERLARWYEGRGRRATHAQPASRALEVVR
jgi:rSAM/selenodomain-associated transferase 2/rSAM/selenodomain-associated transferase 1